jgi:hypothetical protein
MRMIERKEGERERDRDKVRFGFERPCSISRYVFHIFWNGVSEESRYRKSRPRRK